MTIDVNLDVKPQTNQGEGGRMCLQSLCALQFLSEIERDIPYRDLAEIIQKWHSHCVIFTTCAKKSYDAPAMSLQVP